MRNEIIDDKLITKVGQELARIGLFTPISEIEKTGIESYDNIRKAHSLAPTNVTVDTYIKDELYYEIMTCVICASIIANTRLKGSQDGYEATCALTTIQKYLDRLANVAGTERQEAPLVYSELIGTLKIDLEINGDASGGWTANIPHEKGGSPIGVTEVNTHSSDPKFNPNLTSSPSCGAPDSMEVMAYRVNPDGSYNKITPPKYVLEAIRDIMNNEAATTPADDRICSNCDYTLCGKCDGCKNCNETECGADVTVTINYRGTCFGFRIDPGVVGIDRASYSEDELNSCRGTFNSAIINAGKLLAKHSNEMFAAFNKRYLEDLED